MGFLVEAGGWELGSGDSDDRLRCFGTRAPHLPAHPPLTEEKILEPAEVLAAPADFHRTGQEVREQLHFSRIRTVRPALVRARNWWSFPKQATACPSIIRRE